MTHYTIFSDGGSRGNPGPAAIGYIIYDPNGELIVEVGRYIGPTTNNQAEYQAIVSALEYISKMNITTPIVCKLDSQLVVRQINGVYRMKHPQLRPWLDKINLLKSSLKVPLTFIDIPREENQAADRLVNQALNEAR